MGWKNWPSWIKVVILAFISAIILITFFIIDDADFSLNNVNWHTFGFLILIALIFGAILIPIIFPIYLFSKYLNNKNISHGFKGFILGIVIPLYLAVFPLIGELFPKSPNEMWGPSILSAFLVGGIIITAPLGLIIGWIVGKIKSRKQEEQTQ